jgi:hypothetical protein
LGSCGGSSSSSCSCSMLSVSSLTYENLHVDVCSCEHQLLSLMQLQLASDC